MFFNHFQLLSNETIFCSSVLCLPTWLCATVLYLQVAKIETEKMLIQMVETELERRKQAGTYKFQFKGQSHFFGYYTILLFYLINHFSVLTYRLSLVDSVHIVLFTMRTIMIENNLSPMEHWFFERIKAPKLKSPQFTPTGCPKFEIKCSTRFCAIVGLSRINVNF